MKWTAADLQTLRDRYPVTRTPELAEQMGRAVGSVYQRALKLGLRKSPEYMASGASTLIRPGHNRGGDQRFKPGHATWNKGIGWQAGGASIATRFKPGNMPQTWRPVGSERVDKDGVLLRKVSDTRNKRVDWRPVHCLIWEEHNGPIPSGQFVIFSNRDRRDFRIENLRLVTRQDLMEHNSYHRYPASLKGAIVAAGKLRRAIEGRA